MSKRSKAGDPDWGHICPYCGGPKTEQARKCRLCHNDQWRGLHEQLNATEDALLLLYRWATGETIGNWAEVEEAAQVALRVREQRAGRLPRDQLTLLRDVRSARHA
jgi:hypothetical protein